MTITAKNVEGFRRGLLVWYGRHRRILPWRALPGQTADPYHVWLSEIMLQQTTVQAVIPYFLKFLEKWPSVHDLAAASSEDIMQAWAGLGYYARARNLHKCAIYVSRELGGYFPQYQDELKQLPGVGDYTSAAIVAIAFNKPANVVDGNVERVMARIFAVTEPLPDVKPRLKILAAAMAEGEERHPGDYAQALMDLGATICIPSSPRCMLCPVRDHCDGRSLGIAASLPARRAKQAKPGRHGYVYWITDGEGRYLFERRPEKGLLGGTIGLPTSAWVDLGEQKTHLPYADSAYLTPVSVKHVFTHFGLELSGASFQMTNDALPETGRYFWADEAEIKTLGLPTLFKKALRQFMA